MFSTYDFSSFATSWSEGCLEFRFLRSFPLILIAGRSNEQDIQDVSEEPAGFWTVGGKAGHEPGQPLGYSLLVFVTWVMIPRWLPLPLPRTFCLSCAPCAAGQPEDCYPRFPALCPGSWGGAIAPIEPARETSAEYFVWIHQAGRLFGARGQGWGELRCEMLDVMSHHQQSGKVYKINSNLIWLGPQTS